MKKIKRIALLSSLPLLLGVAGCGKVVTDNVDGGGQSLDSNKETIYLTAFDGGFHYGWIINLLNEYNAANRAGKYQIAITASNTDVAGKHLNNLEADFNSAPDIYFGGELGYQKGFAKDYFEDLTDIWEGTAPNETTKIKDKVINKELWEKACKFTDGKYYMVPHTSTIQGLVFDYDLYVENDWLIKADISEKDALAESGIETEIKEDAFKNKYLTFKSFTKTTGSPTDYDAYRCLYEVGDTVLSAGKNGIYGDYDDGQPTTWDGFDDMLSKVKGSGFTPFGYAGMISHNYLDVMVNNYLAQYWGPEKYKEFVYCDTDGKEIDLVDKNGTSIGKKAITIDNGYEIYQADGVPQAIDFVKKYFYTTNYTSNTPMQGTTENVNSVQMNLIQNVDLSTSGSSDRAYSAIIEGNYWENEAESGFESAAKRDPNRAKGKREYRYMVLPNIDGGYSEKTAMTSLEMGGIVVKKQSDSGRLDYIKNFIKYTLSDASLRKTLKTCSLVRPYKFNVEESDLETLTPFQKSYYYMTQDTDHLVVVQERLLKAGSPITYTSSLKNISLTLPTSILTDLRASSGNVDTIKDKVMKPYSKADWEREVATARQSGFYSEE